jgi:hypothetical protein
MKHTAVVIGIALLLVRTTALAGENDKRACPSLDGEWAGTFDGTFEGDWQATFTQSRANIRATAEITLDSGQRLEAEGSAEIKCESGKTAIAGSGSARDKSGSFSGISNDNGKSLSGTWWSGELFGTWRGERVTDDPAP